MVDCKSTGFDDAIVIQNSDNTELINFVGLAQNPPGDLVSKTVEILRREVHGRIEENDVESAAKKSGLAQWCKENAVPIAALITQIMGIFVR